MLCYKIYFLSKFACSKVCECGVMHVNGTCPQQLIEVLTDIREQCGEDNMRSLPQMSLTEQQWMNGETPHVYKVVRVPQSEADAKRDMLLNEQEINKFEETQEDEGEAMEPPTSSPGDEDGGDDYDYMNEAGLFF